LANRFGLPSKWAPKFHDKRRKLYTNQHCVISL
jgi:hypothetical protein